MITSTLTSYPGKKVTKEFGIISGFDDKLRGIRTTVLIGDYLERALQDLEKNAAELGANAVLGISFALADKTLPVVMGTAVYLEDL
ncbi:hypothetical protein RU97_GL001151 [Enterococcus canis]|uniref:Uncharacterized protein n=1 Tax=Enterococcus canis TaxID=214095 RepID=A0A1L8RII2_9ENTE|nr:heavy metal-binding domain-containing protein [Enterococcus canis]OJG19580.1 hypothetical protein RU97_GL001151 [Enterococcus canis]